jgi:hypothetical protein
MKGEKTMSTILSLAFFVGVTVVISIGTRISLSIFKKELPEVHPLKARRVQSSPSEAQILLEDSGTWNVADLGGTSTRYAWIALGVIAFIVLLMLLIIVNLSGGVL